jgi:predicted nucleotide-binding protein (sugar kinase/HSP70/actin superfamily)
VERPLDAIFFPILTHVPSFTAKSTDNASCPIVAGTPEVIKAAFTKEQDFFATRNIRYLDPAFSFSEPVLMKRRLFQAFERELSITEDESDFAAEQAKDALAAFDRELEKRGRAILDDVEAKDGVAILVLGRPYHSDPGLNHGIPDEFQVLGYPILSIRSIPKDRAFLDRVFRDDLAKGTVEDPLEIGDVWPENYSANSAQRVWAAKFAARHPNVVLLDLSSFKCGHDAPTYGIIDGIVRESAVPHAALHDIDANKPGGSIAIRVKTYVHSLALHEERLKDLRARKVELARRLDEKRLSLLEEKQARLVARRATDLLLSSEIESLRAKVRSWTSDERPEPPAEVKGLIRLGKKTPQGDVVRL